MSTAWEDLLREQILSRRERLEAAMAAAPPSARLAGLLRQIDDALERVDAGSYGRCAHCSGAIETERLLADPLVSVCLGCLSAEETRALEHDLELAARVQSGLLPKQQQQQNWDVAYRYVPAGAVSGDYCDLIRGPDRFIFLVGDVSGKGVAASLLMSQLHAIFRSVPLSADVHELVRTANRVLCESTLATHYATLVCACACADEVTFCNAGHCPPIVIHNGAVTEIQPTGLPLGLFCDTEYECRALPLAPGDIIALYTDGLSEATNRSDEEYGAARLAAVLAECRRLDADALVAACVNDAAAFRAQEPQRDDLTVMVMKKL